MHLPNIVPLCLVCFHVIESYTPATLRALATIQNQKARAIANALTLRARAQYNAAMARSRVTHPSLLDRRVIRDSNKNSETARESYEPVPNQNEAGGTYYDRNYYEDGFDELLVPQVQVENVETTSGPQYSCTVQEFEEEVRPEDLPQISVNFNEEYEKPVNAPIDNNGGNSIAYADVSQNGGCPECQAQAAMSAQDGGSYPQYYQSPNGAKAAEPLIRPHGYSHKHIHSHIHEKIPLHPSAIPTGHKQPLIPSVSIPTGHVTPAVNLHVVQNQNAALVPEMAHSAIQSGFGTAIANHLPMVQAAGKSLLHHGVDVNVHHGLGHGTNVYQSQQVQQMPGSHMVTGSGLGGSSVVQTQSVHQGMRGAEGSHGMDTVGAPNESSFGVEGSGVDQRLGTFTSHMVTPEYKDYEYSNLNKPNNRQGVVKYLEKEQLMHHKLMPHHKNLPKLKPIHSSGYTNGGQKYYPGSVPLGQSQFEGQSNIEDQPLGTFLIDPSRIEPIPTLPHNFVDLDPEKRREAVMNILETEQKNIKSLMEQFDESQHGMEIFDSFSEHHPQENHMQDELHNTHVHGMDIFDRFSDNHPQENRMQDEFHNTHIPEHFHEDHQEPDSQFEVENTDGQKLEAIHKEKDDENVSEMLSKFIENDPKTQQQIGMSNGELMLGNIFQVPERRFSEDYYRSARSPDPINKEELDKILEKERELINILKKNAKHDEDLLMIGYIGDSLLDDFDKRLNKTARKKREIGGQYLAFNRLITDPKTRLDIPRTLENIGSVTKTAFEHEKAPLYHVRNMMGSAQDAMLAAMKIPTKNFLIPSQYEIVNTQGQNERVGAINPSLLPKTDGSNLGEQGLNQNDAVIDTFNKVGSAVRESVLSGQEALGHVGHMANHAKTALHSGRYAAPRMILRQIPHIIREPTKKATIITPRIFDISQDDRVGSSLAKPQPDFVRVGHIFDAVGISNPNARKIEYDKIVIEPKGLFFETFDSAHPTKLLKTFRNMLQGVRVQKANEDDFVGSALNTLNDVRATVGADSLRDFLLKMRQKVGNIVKKDRPLINMEENLIQIPPQKKLVLPSTQQNSVKPSKNNPENPTSTAVESNSDQTSNSHENNRHSRTVDNQLAPNQDNLGVSLFPQDLTHPFMGHMSEPLFHQPYHVINNEEKVGSPFQLSGNPEIIDPNMDKINMDRSLGQILGAINPMMFEKIFNESLPTKDNAESPHAIFHHHHDGHSHGDHMEEDDSLGTSMAIKGNMLKPFMGHASQKMQDNFYGKYTPRGHDEEPDEYIEIVDVPGVPQLADVLRPTEHHITSEMESVEYNDYE